MTIPSIAVQAAPSARTPQLPRRTLRAFLELAFRPLYLAGAAWAAIAVGVWVFAPQWLTGTLNGVAWHAHEMLWGFLATIAAAFLMTAGATWTGINPLKGAPLATACLLWLVARAGFLATAPALFWVATAAELGFFLLAAAAMMRAVYGARSARNYAVPWLLVGLAVADALYLMAARDGDFAVLMNRFDVGLVLMAMIALLIARRVIPFFAMRAVPGLVLPMRMRAGHVQLAACVAAIGGLLAGWSLAVAAALALAGLLSLHQLVTWKPWSIRGQPLLWILYAGYAGLGVGLVIAGVAAAGVEMPPALPVHVIAVAGFSVLVIGMMTRTALGHLGLPLAAGRYLTLVYALMLAAVALRLCALVPSASSLAMLRLSALAWVAVFVLYLWRFAPLMLRPRR